MDEQTYVCVVSGRRYVLMERRRVFAMEPPRYRRFRRYLDGDVPPPAIQSWERSSAVLWDDRDAP